jgi:hypothetical protein
LGKPIEESENVKYWAECRIELVGITDVALPPPQDIALLEGLGATAITVSKVDASEKLPTQTHIVRVEFEGGSDLQGDLLTYGDEVLDRVVDLIGVMSGISVSILSSTAGWVDDEGKGHAIMTSVGKGRPATNLLFDSSNQPIQLGATERERKALRYLRRGMGQESVDDRFNLIFLAVMVLARGFEVQPRAPELCPHCGGTLLNRPTGEREYLLNLSTVLDEWAPETLQYLWNVRNKLPGHARAHLTREARRELAEASVTAARLAYDAISVLSADQLPDRPHEIWKLAVTAASVEMEMTYTRKTNLKTSDIHRNSGRFLGRDIQP